MVTQPHLSSTALGVVLVVVAGAFYGLTKVFGSRMDGERKAGKDEHGD